MPRPPDIEMLKAILSNDDLHIMCGIVLKTTLSDDRSVLFVRFTLVPDGLEMVGRMSWEAIGPDAGCFQFPQQNDLVLVAFVEGDEDQVFIIRRLTSKVDRIPLQAVTGDTVRRALAGKQAHLLSDTAILLGRGGDDPTERLVLGEVFKTAYSTHLDTDSKHKHIGNLGFFTAPPDLASTYTGLKASPVDDAAMLSDVSKTEK